MGWWGRDVPAAVAAATSALSLFFHCPGSSGVTIAPPFSTNTSSAAALAAAAVASSSARAGSVVSPAPTCARLISSWQWPPKPSVKEAA